MVSFGAWIHLHIIVLTTGLNFFWYNSFFNVDLWIHLLCCSSYCRHYSTSRRQVYTKLQLTSHTVIKRYLCFSLFMSLQHVRLQHAPGNGEWDLCREMLRGMYQVRHDNDGRSLLPSACHWYKRFKSPGSASEFQAQTDKSNRSQQVT